MQRATQNSRAEGEAAAVDFSFALLDLSKTLRRLARLQECRQPVYSCCSLLEVLLRERGVKRPVFDRLQDLIVAVLDSVVVGAAAAAAAAVVLVVGRPPLSVAKLP